MTMPYAHCKGILMGTMTMELGGKVGSFIPTQPFFFVLYILQYSNGQKSTVQSSVIHEFQYEPKTAQNFVKKFGLLYKI